MTWIYSQSTGQLTHDSEHVGWGYSGWGPGVNFPLDEMEPGVGPIPRGSYSIELIRGEDGQPADYEGKRAPVLRLVADPETNTFGRNGFLMHGDSVSAPGTASHGCIVIGHAVRQTVAESGDTDLQVTT